MNRFALILLTACAWGQSPIPASFSAVGLAAQGGRTSGWGEACHRAPDSSLFGLIVPAMGCLASDYRAASTSARVDVDTILKHTNRFSGGTKTGLGGAYNATSHGSSVTLGVWSAVRLGTVYIVGSLCWSHDDLTTISGSPGAVAQKLRAVTILRLGIGKGWM